MNKFKELYETIDSEVRGIKNCTEKITYINNWIEFLKNNCGYIKTDYKNCTENLKDFNTSYLKCSEYCLTSYIIENFGGEILNYIITYYWYKKCIDKLINSAFIKLS